MYYIRQIIAQIRQKMQRKFPMRITLKKAVFALRFKKPSVITLRVALRIAVCLSDSSEKL